MKFTQLLIFCFCSLLLPGQEFEISTSKHFTSESFASYLKYDNGEHYLFHSPTYGSRRKGIKQWLTVLSENETQEKLEMQAPYEHSFGSHFFERDKKLFRFLMVRDEDSQKKFHRKIVSYSDKANLEHTWHIDSVVSTTKNNLPG